MEGGEHLGQDHLEEIRRREAERRQRGLRRICTRCSVRLVNRPRWVCWRCRDYVNKRKRWVQQKAAKGKCVAHRCEALALPGFTTCIRHGGYQERSA